MRRLLTYGLKRTQSWTSFREPDTLEYRESATPFDLLTGLASQWNADGQMAVRERMHDEAGGYEWGEVFRYDRMSRLIKMWYDVRNPGGFASSDPEEGTNPYDHRKSWGLGPVYERETVKNKPYNQTEAITTYTVNEHYQVTAGPAAMTWNDNGYLTGRGADDFAWTALGQLTQAATDGGSTLDYVYDAFGRRVKTTVGSQVNRFLYHGWHMIGEWDDTADAWLWQEAPWNGGERMLEHIALDTSDVDGDENVNEYRQYAAHEDFQDTVWGLSDAAAAIVERYNYTDPYGASDTDDSGGSGLGDFATEVFHRKRLHGGFIEVESELYDFRNRWMMADSGIWCSQDPMGALDSPNYYQFTLSNPLMKMDQFGLQIQDPDEWEKKQLKQLLGDQYYALVVFRMYYAVCMRQGVGSMVRAGKCSWDRIDINGIRHCTVSCLIAQNSGPEKAWEAGRIHERADWERAKANGEDMSKAAHDAQNDMIANARGIEAAKQGKECCCACREVYGCPCEGGPPVNKTESSSGVSQQNVAGGMYE